MLQHSIITQSTIVDSSKINNFASLTKFSEILDRFPC